MHNKRNGFEEWAAKHFKKITPESYYHFRVRYIEAVEMLKTNNPDLKVLNLNNHKEINDAKLLEVIKALSNHTTIKVIALANTNMRDVAALVSTVVH